MMADAEGEFEVLRDRLADGHRQVVVRAEAPAYFSRSRDELQGWSVSAMRLEEIFIELVRKRNVA